MSRIGKQQIKIPEKTEISVSGGVLMVKGPLGDLSRKLNKSVSIKIDEDSAFVIPKDDSVESRAMWGTFASHLKNMISGVNAPFEKKLVVEGIGYRAELAGRRLILSVGFSHPVEFNIPDGLNVSVEKNTITVSGSDKEQVGQFTSNVRAAKKPEPYKGKGIRYIDEIVRRKQGKRAIT